MNTDDEDPQQLIKRKLKRLRGDTGLSGREFATRCGDGWTQSKVSRLESGRYQPKPEDIRTWVASSGGTQDDLALLLDLLSVFQDGHRSWNRQMRKSALGQSDYVQLVSDATRILHFETAYMPGLIQTAPYARHVIGEVARLNEVEDPDVDAAVQSRMQRQAMLYDLTKRFEFLITEAVLRWRPVPTAVMRGQLDRLGTLIDLPNVRFGIIPFAAPITLVPQNSFQVYDELAVVETFVGEWTHNEAESALYSRVAGLLWRDAREGPEARQLIAAAIGDLPLSES